MSSARLTLVASLLASALLGATAMAQTYQPLDVGTRWIYGSTVNPGDTVVVIGPTVFDGTDVVELRYYGFNGGLSNFWSVAPDGSVYFHGFDRPDESFGVRYIPPFRMIQTPVIAGRTWRDTVHDHCTRSPCPPDSAGTIYDFTVNGIAPITVPAGTFMAAEIEMTFIDAEVRRALSGSGYTLFGTKAAPPNAIAAAGGASRWWAEGVGLVQDYYGWQLLSFDRITPARPMSWGRLKERYR